MGMADAHAYVTYIRPAAIADAQRRHSIGMHTTATYIGMAANPNGDRTEGIPSNVLATFEKQKPSGSQEEGSYLRPQPQHPQIAGPPPH